MNDNSAFLLNINVSLKIDFSFNQSFYLYFIFNQYLCFNSYLYLYLPDPTERIIKTESFDGFMAKSEKRINSLFPVCRISFLQCPETLFLSWGQTMKGSKKAGYLRKILFCLFCATLSTNKCSDILWLLQLTQ